MSSSIASIWTPSPQLCARQAAVSLPLSLHPGDASPMISVAHARAMAHHDLAGQLAVPDRIGRDLALYRSRVYRFSNDLRHYILAEVLEENYLAGHHPADRTLQYVRSCLKSLRLRGSLLSFRYDLAEVEGIDIKEQLALRESHMHGACQATEALDLVVVIVGAPRSGTTHLYNLLASRSEFAYFTTVSCWAWPTYNLRRPHRFLFTEAGTDVLAVDNKKTRLLPGLVMPYEAEDVYARACPAYRHVRGHHYALEPARAEEASILTRATFDHLRHFDSPRLLTKSPFNSLRIPHLDRMWSADIRYIHIIRDQHETADSIRRNGFMFSVDGKTLAAEDAWSFFNRAVEKTLPAGRSMTVHHQDLLTDPSRVTTRIRTWLGL